MQVFSEFPYDKRFSREEIAEITARSERIKEAARDGVAPNGAIMQLPEDMLALWSVHLALAGLEVHDDLAHIIAIPDPEGPFTDSKKWILKEDAEKLGPTPEEEAAKYTAALKKELSPAAQKILADQLKGAV